jgi:DNA phosphorothioation-dependent restriction protein DptG
MAYMKNKLGLSSSSFNIYSVLSPTSTAELDSLSTSASSKTSSDSVSAYQNFLSDNPIGTFLNTSA